jgi:mRNA interferase MazF
MPQRGEIWWVRLDQTIGSEIRKTRPCLVVSTNVINERRRTVVVIPLSSSPKPSPPLLIPLMCAGRAAVAIIDQIRAISKERLDRIIGSVSNQEIEAVENGLRRVLELG